MGLKFLRGVTGLVFMLTLTLASCGEDDEGKDDGIVVVPPNPPAEPFDINSITDTYPSITSLDNRHKWGPYNVHDPSIIKDGEYYYCYSTDAGYGIEVPAGHQIRRSKDLVEWEFVGWVFSGVPKKGGDFIESYGGTPFESLWAPDVVKVGSEYRLYYSLSSAKPRLSVIGLATATNPKGPWTEKGLVVTSLSDNSIQTNAIDPSVIVTETGEHWMYYGSAWDGIYIMEIDPATGLAKTPFDKGKRIAQRGFTGGKVNGNIEGPEIVYNSQLQMYYLFIAYDWLETKYNVRVGRSASPEGPFVDFNGKDMNTEEDNIPMIIAPYKFDGHSGWQGVSHCTVFNDGDKFYIAHQGRPGVDRFYMVLHVRELYWTDEGWPVASPERYAATEQTSIAAADLVGAWERIVLNYTVVPGYSEEQTAPGFQNAVAMTLNEGGTINSDDNSTWVFTAPWLTLQWSEGKAEKVMVTRGRDWENKKNCLVFSGLDNTGTAVWGKH
jgi:arabinan endo-1,5-alpha-L-arabinosidase